MPTPFSVGAGEVKWVGTAADGSMAYNAASVGMVCPIDSAVDCATLDGFGERLALTSTPKSIIGSPTEGQAVVVSDDGAGGQQVLVLSLPESRESAEPSASPTPGATEPGATRVDRAEHHHRATDGAAIDRTARDRTAADRGAESVRERQRPGCHELYRTQSAGLGDPHPQSRTDDRREPRHRERYLGGGRFGCVFGRWDLVRLHCPTGRRTLPALMSTSGGSATRAPGP